MQKKFREENLLQETYLIPEYQPDLKCDHECKFDSRCPKMLGNIQSKIVKLYDTDYTPHIERTPFYRKTLGNCRCIQIVLNCTRETGKVVHLVTYNLLHNFTWLFAKTGVSRRGFLAALNSRHMDQYGALEEDLLPWPDMRNFFLLSDNHFFN